MVNDVIHECRCGCTDVCAQCGMMFNEFVGSVCAHAHAHIFDDSCAHPGPVCVEDSMECMQAERRHRQVAWKCAVKWGVMKERDAGGSACHQVCKDSCENSSMDEWQHQHRKSRARS